MIMNTKATIDCGWGVALILLGSYILGELSLATICMIFSLIVFYGIALPAIYSINSDLGDDRL